MQCKMVGGPIDGQIRGFPDQLSDSGLAEFFPNHRSAYYERDEKELWCDERPKQ